MLFDTGGFCICEESDRYLWTIIIIIMLVQCDHHVVESRLDWYELKDFVWNFQYKWSIDQTIDHI